MALDLGLVARGFSNLGGGLEGTLSSSGFGFRSLYLKGLGCGVAQVGPSSKINRSEASWSSGYFRHPDSL